MPILLEGKVNSDTVAATATGPPPAQVMRAWTGGGRFDNLLNSAGSLNVAIVDDDRDTADSLAMLVKLWGHQVRVAYSPAALLALAANEFPDVLCIDIGMPTMDGARLARHLRGRVRRAGALLIAITGWADKAHRCLWESAFDHYLVKPIVPPKLETLLRERARLVQSRPASRRQPPYLASVHRMDLT